MKNFKETVISKKKIMAVATFVAAAVAVLFSFSLYTKATNGIAESNLEQVTIKYYVGVPELVNTSAPTYVEAISSGQSGVSEQTYTTVSVGVLQWGDENEDGTYDVYFDASDIHKLAQYINATQEQYNELYTYYQSMVEWAK